MRLDARSLTFRLAAAFTAAAALLLAAAVIILYYYLRTGLHDASDRLLANRAGVLRTILESEPLDAEEIRENIEIEKDAKGRDIIYLRVLFADGTIVTESRGMSQAVPETAFQALALSTPTRPHGADWNGGRRPMRLYVTSANYYDHPGELLRIEAAVEAGNSARLLENFSIIAGFILLGGCAGASILSLLIARTSAIKPLLTVTKTLQRVHGDHLTERVSSHDLPTEIALLASQFNEMLDRLERSFAQIQQFSADIAHEIRTPLSSLRLSLEVEAGRLRKPEEYQLLLESSLEQVDQLNRIMDALLFLARADAGVESLHAESIQIQDLLSECVQLYEPLATSRNILIQLEADPGLTLHADRTLVQRAVSNIISNSLHHMRKAGRMDIHATSDPLFVILRFHDNGIGIPSQHLPRVLDRFHKADPSRTSGHGGAGLGLSIVRSIMAVHGGSIHIESVEGEGTTVILRFPRRAATVHDPDSRASSK